MATTAKKRTANAKTQARPAKKGAKRQASKPVRRQSKKPLAYTAKAWMAAYVAAAIVIPQVTLLWRPLVGTYATVFALVALLILALRSEQARRLAIAAAILPVTLLVSLSLPQSDAFTQAGEFYSTVLLLVIMCNYTFSFHEPLDFSALGKQYWLLLPLMVVVGEVLGALGYGALRNTPYIFHGVPTYLVAVGAVIFAVAEELLFRGHIQQQAGKVLHPVVAAALTVVVYATVYMAHGSALPFIFALLSGTVLSTVYYFKQNLLLTTTANAVMKLTYLGLLATFVLH
jgi:membrane protease YdiL (CAAX protease family)